MQKKWFEFIKEKGGSLEDYINYKQSSNERQASQLLTDKIAKLELAENMGIITAEIRESRKKEIEKEMSEMADKYSIQNIGARIDTLYPSLLRNANGDPVFSDGVSLLKGLFKEDVLPEKAAEFLAKDLDMPLELLTKEIVHELCEELELPPPAIQQEVKPVEKAKTQTSEIKVINETTTSFVVKINRVHQSMIEVSILPDEKVQNSKGKSEHLRGVVVRYTESPKEFQVVDAESKIFQDI